ncbi:MAG TPA: response regulator, partial [Chryseolinea sp.]|nr:response regulator [Chryseolinea sp.]
IIVAHDGPAAFSVLEGLNGNLPKLIILDVNMPLMDGLTFYTKLKSTYNIPVIFYTTSCDDDLVKKATGLGVIDCVKKGVTYADNLSFARRVFDFVRIGT